MRASVTFRGRLASALVLTSALVLGLSADARAQAPPAYMDLIMGQTSTPPTQVGEQHVLALNVAKFGFYDRALRLYRQRLLAQHPVILGLFSGAGGDFTLYRPGMAPLRAPSVAVWFSRMAVDDHARPRPGNDPAAPLSVSLNTHLRIDGRMRWI